MAEALDDVRLACSSPRLSDVEPELEGWTPSASYSWVPLPGPVVLAS